MAKDDLSVSIRADISEALKKMSTAEMTRLFMGLPRGSGKTTAATAAASFAGLRAALGASPLPNPWKFGTIHRNKISDERVMAVGHRRVIGLNGRADHVSDTVEDWFDYWEVFFEEVT